MAAIQDSRSVSQRSTHNPVPVGSRTIRDSILHALISHSSSRK